MILIEERVKASKPNSSNFEIIKIYTENIDDNQVSAHFSYKFTEELLDKSKVNQTMSGEAVLYRGLSENQKDDKWVIKSIKTDNPKIEFQQGVVVTPENTPATTEVLPIEEKKTQ